MAKSRTDNRVRLVQAAAKLVYEHGFSKTTIADVAQEASIPVGNVYHYFKTKNEIGEAIVEQRMSEWLTLRNNWEEERSPKERLSACVRGMLETREFLARGGCPLGTFCSELHKEGGSLATKATAVFSAHLDWFEAQFRSLGKKEEARALAVHLLSTMQGVSHLAHIFHNPDLVITEVGRLQEWIQSL